MEKTNSTTNTNNIEKPISLILEESKRVIIDAVNSTNLHPTLLELIIKDVYNEVRERANYQYEFDKNEYEQKIHEPLKESTPKE